MLNKWRGLLASGLPKAARLLFFAVHYKSERAAGVILNLPLSWTLLIIAQQP
jgi:hypothetical protein